MKSSEFRREAITAGVNRTRGTMSPEKMAEQKFVDGSPNAFLRWVLGFVFMYQQGYQFDVWGEKATLHHIGLAVAHIEDVALPRLETVIDSIQKVKIAFVQMNDCCIELLEPLDADSPITNSLKKNNKLLHLCFEVVDLAKALDAAGTHGFRIVKKPVPAAAFSGRHIAWVFSPLWGLIELLDREKKL